MIPSSGQFKIAAAVLAVLGHGVLAYALYAPEPVQIEDRAGRPGEVRLGSSFQDMAAGRLTAEPVDGAGFASPPPPPRSAPRPQVADTPRVTPFAPLPPSSPRQTALRGDPAPAPQPTVDLPLAGPAPARALAAPAPRPLTSVTPSAPGTTRPVAAPREVLSALPAATAPLSSVRPPVRSAAFEVENAPKIARPSSGNASASAVAGAHDGSRAATATRNGGASDGGTAGNAAARSYPGEVAACVRRTAGRFAGGGQVGLRFRVSDGGAIASAAVVRSSGSRRIDQSALRAIRGAGPCPRPPAGARRSFTITIG